MMWMMAFTLFFTGKWLGRLEECMCDGQKTQGVLAQILTLQAVRKEFPFPFLFHTGDIVDSSDFLILDISFSILKREGYRFLALGEQELVFTPEEIEQVAENAGIPLLLTNSSLPGPLRWYEEFIDGKKVVFLNLISYAGSPLRWKLEWEEKALEDALFQIGWADEIFLISHLTEGYTEGVIERFGDRFKGIILVDHQPRGKANVPPYWIGVGKCLEVHRIDISDKTGELQTTLLSIPRIVEKPPGEILAEIARTKPPAETRKGYQAGSSLCAGCHSDIVKQWKETKHAKVYEGKVAACEKCHMPLKTIGEKQIGCEICHGPGSRHIFQAYRFTMKKAEKMEKMPAVSQDTCLPCHKPDGKHIKEFSPQKAWQKIVHRMAKESDEKKPAEPTPPEEGKKEGESD